MHPCHVCREDFRPDNPETGTVYLADVEGQAVWPPVCLACAEDLEASELATEHQ